MGRVRRRHATSAVSREIPLFVKVAINFVRGKPEYLKAEAL
jgi:hypothetical protein